MSYVACLSCLSFLRTCLSESLGLRAFTVGKGANCGSGHLKESKIERSPLALPCCGFTWFGPTEQHAHVLCAAHDAEHRLLPARHAAPHTSHSLRHFSHTLPSDFPRSSPAHFSHRLASALQFTHLLPRPFSSSARVNSDASFTDYLHKCHCFSGLAACDHIQFDFYSWSHPFSANVPPLHRTHTH